MFVFLKNLWRLHNRCAWRSWCGHCHYSLRSKQCQKCLATPFDPTGTPCRYIFNG